MWDDRGYVLMAQTADSENRSGFYEGAATSLAFSKDLLRRLMMDKGDKLIGKEESEDEMELNLGLSLGVCHVKAKKEKAGSVNLQLDLQKNDLNCDGGACLDRDSYGHGDFGLQRNADGGADFGFGLKKNDDGGADFGFGLKKNDDGCVDFGFELKQEEVPRIHDPPRPKSYQQQQDISTSQQKQQQEILEQQKKRELHALRRQEARKKREEKQLQKARREAAGGMRSIQPNKVGRNQNGYVPLAPSYAAPFPMRLGGTAFPPMTRVGNVSSEEDKRVLGAQMSSIRDKHRAAKVSEPCVSDRKDKVSKTSDQGDLSVEDKSSRTSHDTENMVSSSNGGRDPPTSNEVSGPERSLPASQAAYPVMPISYPFPVLDANRHCMPMHMSYSFPYMMPFWPAASTGPEASKSSISTPPLRPNVLHPIPTRPFTPFQMPVSGALQTSWFADPQKCQITGPAHSSHASSGRSSSAVSENETRSSPGACSNDSKSQSSESSAMETLQRVSSASKTRDQTVASSEVSSASQIEPTDVVGREKVPSNAGAQSSTTTIHEKRITEAPQQGCFSNTITSKDDPAHQAQSSLPTKTSKDDDAGHFSLPTKASSKDDLDQTVLPSETCKENVDVAHHGESVFAKMPSVSTTGEGGKTINGLLHSYRGGEVSIVCVCHGTFLSPAEFVQHAGRIDISHPERHIVVNASLDGPAMGSRI